MNVEQLVQIIPLLNCDPQEARKVGEENGLTRHDVQAIRHILGYSNEKLGGKLTAEQRDEIAREYADGGVSINQIASKYGVGYNSIYCLLKGRKIDTHNPKLWSPIKEMRLMDCIKKGMSLRSIATLLGKSKSTIEKKVERMKKGGKL